MDYRRYYESAAVRYELPPNEKESHRASEMLALLPAKVDSALDVGCADGRLLTSIEATGRRVGADISMAMLTNFRECLPRVQADVQALPFPSRSFDLVICTEILEHLPPVVFEKALAEIERVAARFILVGVPNQEDLRENSACCRGCGNTFHFWGHLRNFSRSRIANLFPQADVVNCAAIGKPEGYYWSPLLTLRTAVNGGWDRPDIQCPECRRPVQPTQQGSRRFVVKTCDYLQWNFAGRWARRPPWLCALYRKKDCM